MRGRPQPGAGIQHENHVGCATAASRAEGRPAYLPVASLPLLVSSGRAPSASDVAMALGPDVAEVVDGWQRRNDAHALVFEPGTHQIRMLNPFSAIPTAYRVLAAGPRWYAGCAWDAFGSSAHGRHPPDNLRSELWGPKPRRVTRRVTRPPDSMTTSTTLRTSQPMQ